MMVRPIIEDHTEFLTRGVQGPAVRRRKRFMLLLRFVVVVVVLVVPVIVLLLVVRVQKSGNLW